LNFEFLFSYANYKYRERWIDKEWFWYQTQESTVEFSTPISKEEVEKQLEERLEKIKPNLGEETQTEKGKKFEHFADLFDDDAALVGLL
jgi:hypothetical protein